MLEQQCTLLVSYFHFPVHPCIDRCHFQYSHEVSVLDPSWREIRREYSVQIHGQSVSAWLKKFHELFNRFNSSPEDGQLLVNIDDGLDEVIIINTADEVCQEVSPHFWINAGEDELEKVQNTGADVTPAEILKHQIWTEIPRLQFCPADNNVKCYCKKCLFPSKSIFIKCPPPPSLLLLQLSNNYLLIVTNY